PGIFSIDSSTVLDWTTVGGFSTGDIRFFVTGIIVGICTFTAADAFGSMGRAPGEVTAPDTVVGGGGDDGGGDGGDGTNDVTSIAITDVKVDYGGWAQLIVTISGTLFHPEPFALVYDSKFLHIDIPDGSANELVDANTEVVTCNVQGLEACNMHQVKAEDAANNNISAI